MAKKIINVGSVLNDGTGDALRNGAQKINDNFSELYNALGGSNGGPLEIVSKITAGDGIVVSSGFGEVRVSASTASSTTPGVIKIGSGLNMVDGVLSAPSTYSLPRAASNILGGIKVGNNLTVSNDGTLSAIPQNYTLPTATATVKGGVKVGAGLAITDGILSVVSTPASALISDTAILSYSKVEDVQHSVLQSNMGVSLSSIGNLNFTGLLWNNDNLVNQVTVNSLGTTIYHQNISESITQQWRFQPTADGLLVGPQLLLGSGFDSDQLISLVGTNTMYVGNKDFKSYISFAGPTDPYIDIGPRANTVSIISNTTGDYVNGLGYTSQGKILLDAGGGQNQFHASIKMGQMGDGSHDFPPTGDTVVTTTNNIEIVGGAAFYGDLTLTGGSTLAIRNRIVFQDGTIQKTAYQAHTGVTACKDNVAAVPVDVDTIIYATTNVAIGAVKLVVLAIMESTNESQACEIIALMNPAFAGPQGMIISVSAPVFTGLAEIVTFDALYDQPSFSYQVRARPVNNVLGLNVTVQISELYKANP